MQLIDKNKLIETIQQIPCWECYGQGTDECYSCIVYSCIMEKVVDAQVVDAVPVVRGHWELVDAVCGMSGDLMCSNCSNRVWRKDELEEMREIFLRYCPCCGSENGRVEMAGEKGERNE